MSEIIEISGTKVKIGTDGGSIKTVPIASLTFANPKVGDKVKIFQNDKEVIIKRAEEARSHTSSTSANGKEKKINKHVFVWVGNFLFGGLGVDRFMRGQIGVGICKLLFNWWTFGLWSLIDWIISLTKAYGEAYGNTEDITFINGKYSK